MARSYSMITPLTRQFGPPSFRPPISACGLPLSAPFELSLWPENRFLNTQDKKTPLYNACLPTCLRNQSEYLLGSHTLKIHLGSLRRIWKHPSLPESEPAQRGRLSVRNHEI